MTRGHLYKRRRAAMIKVALVVTAGVVLFMPKMEDFHLPDVRSMEAVSFITAAQADEN